MDARMLESGLLAGAAPLKVELTDALIEVLKTKDAGTFSHSNRVGALMEEWIRHLHSRSRWLEIDPIPLFWAAFLHDVGKVGVNNAILNKAGPLTAEERAVLQRHSETGFELVRGIPGIADAALGVLHHHERWDGGGYPSGLKGPAIPVVARFIAIVDAFDAMTSERSYQTARTAKEAIEEIRLKAGTQFCPDLVEEFTQFIDARNA
ncbi:MAG: HD domain-containing protein [Proteobacteria bacterium]|nr:HD domain-containing protein [Pseudomonadota bacterium]